MTVLLTETCNRPAHQLFWRKLLIRSALAAPSPKFIKEGLPWRAYHACDRMVVGLQAERHVMQDVYGVPESAVAVVPLGLTEAFLKAGPPLRTEDHLICTGRIDPVKNSLKLAQLARATNVPILFVGKPFDAQSGFWRQFQSMIDQKIVKHHPHVSGEQEMAELLRKARGCADESFRELEPCRARSCGVWSPAVAARSALVPGTFWKEATYWPGKGSEALKATLRQFYERCPTLAAPNVKLYSWVEVAEILKQVYKSILGV